MTASQPTLFVVGASGFVGSCLAALLRPQFAIVRGSRRPPAGDGIWLPIDITDRDSVAAAFDQARPQIVLLTAAMADMDRCQREPAAAEAVNHAGARCVAQECRRRGARLFFTSTDIVFDGSQGFYRETDPANPLNVYGQTKAQAERSVLELLPAAVILRLSLVLGRSAEPGRNSYVDHLAESLRAGQQVGGYTFEYRNPIDVHTLARVFLALLAQPAAQGIFHVGACDKITRFELARRLARQLGYAEDRVLPQHDPTPGRAARPRDTFLASERIREICSFDLPTCQEVIERSVQAVA